MEEEGVEEAAADGARAAWRDGFHANLPDRRRKQVYVGWAGPPSALAAPVPAAAPPPLLQPPSGAAAGGAQAQPAQGGTTQAIRQLLRSLLAHSAAAGWGGSSTRGAAELARQAAAYLQLLPNLPESTQDSHNTFLQAICHGGRGGRAAAGGSGASGPAGASSRPGAELAPAAELAPRVKLEVVGSFIGEVLKCQGRGRAQQVQGAPVDAEEEEDVCIL